MKYAGEGPFNDGYNLQEQGAPIQDSATTEGQLGWRWGGMLEAVPAGTGLVFRRSHNHGRRLNTSKLGLIRSLK